MEKQRKEVRDYPSLHASDVGPLTQATFALKQAVTPANSTQLYFATSLRGYLPKGRTPASPSADDDHDLNESAPPEVTSRRFTRPRQPKLFNLASTRLREGWGIDNYPKFLPPRISKAKERFRDTPGVIRSRGVSVVKSNSPASKTQLVSALYPPLTLASRRASTGASSSATST